MSATGSIPAVEVLTSYYMTDNSRVLTDCDLGYSTPHPFIGSFDDRFVAWDNDEGLYSTPGGYCWLVQSHYPERPFETFDRYRDWYHVNHGHAATIHELEQAIDEWFKNLVKKRSY